MTNIHVEHGDPTTYEVDAAGNVMKRTLATFVVFALLLTSVLILPGSTSKANDSRDTKDAALKATAGGDLEAWLKNTWDPSTQPTTAPHEGTNPFDSTDRSHRRDAVPGVIELSDGRVLGGRICTTRGKPWLVYSRGRRRWRRIPPVAVLSITGIVIEEKMEQQWRWKEMGVPERIFTGKEYPTRRMKWRFHLIDGSYLSGTVKGQPLWIEHAGKRTGPFVLHERSKGEVGQKLADLVHVKRVLISRKMMDHVLKEQQTARTYQAPSKYP